MSYKIEKTKPENEIINFKAKYLQDCQQNGYKLTFAENEIFIYALEKNEILKDSEVIINPNYESELAQNREELFNKDFFSTTIGYVRRKAYIQGTGEIKDFLSDCLSVLCNAFALGQNIQAIVYEKPSMTADVSDWTQYQKTVDWTKTVQQSFLGECLIQYQKDFFDAE